MSSRKVDLSFAKYSITLKLSIKFLHGRTLAHFHRTICSFYANSISFYFKADLESFRASYEKALLYTYGRAILINFLIHHSTASSMVQYKCNELIPFLPIKQKLWTYHYIELLKVILSSLCLSFSF